MQHRRGRKKGIRFDTGVLFVSTFIISSCPAVEQSKFSDSLRYDRSVLNKSVFQARSQERLLTAAQGYMSSGNYSAAFDVLRELFRQPQDSSQPVPDIGPISGTRSAALRSISRLPFSVRRDWNHFCQGPGTAALNNACRSSSRAALAQVAAEFPFSSVAADAFFTETILSLSRRQIASAHMALRELQILLPMGVLTRVQTIAVRRLMATMDADAASHSVDEIERSKDRPLLSIAHPGPSWGWKANAWRHPEGPDALPLHGLGSQFDHSNGWQNPILHKDCVITRTPAGIASLDRFSGAQQWFLPFRSVVTRHPDAAAGSAIFEITRIPQHRLELSGEVIYFVDGRQDTSVRPLNRNRSPLVIEPGATHLVAVRTGQCPVVLWQAGTEQKSRSNGNHHLSRGGEEFQYAFEIPSVFQPFTDSPADDRPTHVAENRLTGHLFLSAPSVYAGRLYVMTRHDGVAWLNCLSAAHGSLYWQQPLTWLESKIDVDPYQSAIVGGVTDGKVICLFANGLIAGCSPIDGRIEWIQSVLFQNESVAKNVDFWLAAQKDSRVVPQTGVGSAFGDLWLQLSPAGIFCSRRGSPGISCLDSATGEIRWSSSRGVRGGTAANQQDLTCLGVIESQLVTAGYGHCRAINVTDGTQSWVRPLGNHDGRICIDQNNVYIALNSGRLLTVDGRNGSVVQSEQLNLSNAGPGLVCDRRGIVAASAWSVRSWKWRNQLPAAVVPGVEEALDSLATHRLHELRLLIPNLTPPTIHSVEECMAVATASQLSVDQQLKLALLTPDVSGHQALLEEQLRSKPNQIIQLLPGWALPLCTAVRTLGHSTLSFVAPLTQDESILFPTELGLLKSQLAAANDLINGNRLSEAELLLLNMDVARNTQQAGLRDKLLRIARASALVPGVVPTTPIKWGTAEFHVTQSLTDGFRLNDIAALHKRFRLQTPEGAVPSWSKLLFITYAGISPHVGLIDLARGIETDSASRSSIRFPSNVSSQGDWNRPGLIVVTPRKQIGVISLLGESPLTPLWLQYIDDDAVGQVIALTSRHLIISSSAGLQSLHPLTGHLQWSRDWKQSRELQHLEGQYLKVYCSDRHIVLLSSFGTGYIVLRATDGAVLREDSRPAGRLSRVIGEYLLTTTVRSQLELTHLVSGKQIPVELDGHAVVGIHPAGSFDKRKTIVMTEKPEFMILDLLSGKVETRVPVPSELMKRTSTRFDARLIRRAGLVYVALSVRSWRSPYIPESVFGEAVTGRGVLICIDPDTGEELWQQERNSAVIPPIFGDPCPFLVLWSTRYTSSRRQFRFSSGRQQTFLEITVLDAFTGRIVATTAQQVAARPLQVLHDAQEQQLRIITEHSTIHMDYTK